MTRPRRSASSQTSAETSVNTGTLARQQVSRATLLSSLNGGDGVSITDFRITDTAGQRQQST